MKNSITILCSLFLVICFGLPNQAYSQYTSAQSGDFETGSTWASGNAPTLASGFKLADNVTITTGHTVTVNGEIRVKSGVMLTIAGTLVISGLCDFQNGSIINVTSTGTLVMNSGENSNNSTDVVVEGTVICNGNFSAGTGSNIGGSGSVSVYGTSSGSGTIFGASTGCNFCSFSSSGSTGNNVSGVQIGGTDTWVGASCPIEPYYGYTYSQSIYTAQELTDAGLQAGSEISALIYELNTSSLSSSDNWTVYIGHTSTNYFSGTLASQWKLVSTMSLFASQATPTVVSNGTYYDVRVGGIPFTWDGSSNIVIATDENAAGYGSNSHDFLCRSTSTYNRSLTYYSDGINPDPSNMPYNPSAMKAYVPNLKVVASNIACTPMPFAMNMESGCTWDNSGWSFLSGATTSSGTGPNDATVFGSDPTSNSSSSQYAYAETSGNESGTFIMTSKCFDFSQVSSPKASFSYHAYGSSIGTMQFDYSVDEGTSFTTLWLVTGQQHSSATEAATYVEVPGMSSLANRSSVLFRIKYVAAGISYTGDMAIDDIVIDTDISWTGAVSQDWNLAGNWSNNEVPTSSSDVLIPSSATVPPIIENATGTVRNITIESGVVLAIVNAQELQVNGNWTNNGTIDSPDGTINFTGSNGTNLLNGGVQNFYSIRVSNASGITVESGTYNVFGALYPDGGVITTNNAIVIASNSSATGRIMSSAIRGYSLVINDSYGDGWDGAFLTVSVDGVSQGDYGLTSGSSITHSINLSSFTSGQTFAVAYTAGSWESEHSYSVVNSTGNTVYSSGSSPSAGIQFSTTLDQSSPFSGNVTVQQHLVTTKVGWREFTCGVENMTLQEFSDDGVFMSGFTGSSSPGPGFVSAYTYDETLANGNKDNGWTPATHITNPTAPSSAHRMYLGANTFNFDFTGTPGYGRHYYNISYQNSSSAESWAGEDEKGWNFIGNPYPCPISWDALTKVNIDDQIWIYSAENGNYGLYVGGAGSGTGTNSVDREIPAHQGVWVHANAYGASINITEAAKQDVSASLVKSQTESPFFKIRLTNSSNAYQDEVILGQDPDATFGYDVDKDGYKLFTNVSTAPSLWMLADTVPVTLNKVKVDESFEVILHYSSSVIGSHTLLFTNPGVMNFDGCLVLEDMELNVFTPIVDSLSYTFNSNPLLSSDDRFKLHYYPTSAVVATGSACHGGIDGEIAIDFGGIPPFSATLTSSASVTTVFNDSVGVFAGLLPGSYELEVGGGKGCASEQFQLEIADPAELQIAQDVTNVTSGCDGAIRLNAMGGQSPYTYYIDGVEGSSQDSLCAGSYDVVVVDANSCSTQETIELSSGATEVTDFSVHSFAVLPNPSEGQFRILSEGNSHIRIYSVTGQIVRELKFNSTKMIDMTGVDKGVYIVRDMETGDMMEIVLI